MTGKLDLTGVPGCTQCGVCCFSQAEDYLRVAGTDHERLGADAERLTKFLGNRLYMKMSEGHCAALVFQESTREFLCSIYEKRPDVCRWLERGSGYCNAERHEKADRTLVMLRVAR